MTDDSSGMLPARLSHPEMQLAGGLGMPAGGGPKPVLDFDFTTISTLDSRISFSRASSATRVNASGYIETVAANQPRFSHDPVTLRPLGLLVEDQRTNMLLHSQDFGSAIWTKTRCSLVTTGAMTPSGEPDAVKLVENGTSGDHLISQSVAFTAGSHTRSVYLKPAGRSWAKLACGGMATAYFDLSTGSVGSISGTGTPSAQIQPAGNGWYRVSLSFTATAGTVSVSTGCAVVNGSDLYSGDGSSGLLLWGDQLEAGGFATSYIPTAGAAVTRMMDLPVIPSAVAGPILAEGQGCITINSDFPRAANGEIVCVDDGIGANSLEIYRSSLTTLNFFAKADSNVVADISSFPRTSDLISVIIMYDWDNYTVNFGSMGSRSGSISGTQSLNTIRFGQYRSPGFAINGHIAKFVYSMASA
ncbi:phage head spike fiber domain-containing protein [Rhizorhabdus phycosphaerae]|uniref:phage head spike fiber domain-containing protein n=1 Tax=Rhizorhabdus phycosphaerae TaxID=2711156 RepID=UPI0013EDB912|nr:hypothetical protein [Rhizorhabdus phycosphaerae]